MRPTLIALVAALALASAADAVSLTVTPDQASYDVGDTILLSIVGDVSGADPAYSIFGKLSFDVTKFTPLGATQSQMTSFGGSVSWAVGTLPSSADYQTGYQTVFNQIAGLSPLPPDGNLFATAAFQVDASGPYDFYWVSNLDFFGLTSDGTLLAAHIGTTPEPATAALLGGGLVALALARRRRR